MADTRMEQGQDTDAFTGQMDYGWPRGSYTPTTVNSATEGDRFSISHICSCISISLQAHIRLKFLDSFLIQFDVIWAFFSDHLICNGPEIIVENTGSHLTRSNKMEGKDPLRDITNVHSATSAEWNQSIAREQNYPKTDTKGVIQMSSQRKRYRDRDRYLRMTPDQREAYLQRNREYKRMRRDCSAGCNNVIPTPRQINLGINNTIYMTGDFSKPVKGKEDADNSSFRSFDWLQENVLHSNHVKHEPAITRQCSSSKGNQVAGNGGYDTCRPRAGTRFTISSSGINLSSISSEHQAGNYELKTVGKRKRHRSANVYSELSHGQKVTCMEENCGHNKRKRSEKASCSSTQCSGRDDNDLHEDNIYMPKDCFPAIHDHGVRAEDIIDCEDVDDESLIYIGPSLDFQSYQEPNPIMNGLQVDPYDHIYHNLPRTFYFLEQVPNYRHCNAKRFQYETPTFCCMNGKIKVVTPLVLDELRDLYTSQEPNAKYFQDHIRYFNSHFSFTSLGVVLDQRFCSGRSGVYTFRAQGQIYHRID
uniref:Uncharacterized protein n=1 Tax=Avena sativa TaxID=4498 RepID=A0ACD5VYB2_AVESA